MINFDMIKQVKLLFILNIYSYLMANKKASLEEVLDYIKDIEKKWMQNNQINFANKYDEIKDYLINNFKTDEGYLSLNDKQIRIYNDFTSLIGKLVIDHDLNDLMDMEIRDKFFKLLKDIISKVDANNQEYEDNLNMIIYYSLRVMFSYNNNRADLIAGVFDLLINEDKYLNELNNLLNKLTDEDLMKNKFICAFNVGCIPKYLMEDKYKRGSIYLKKYDPRVILRLNYSDIEGLFTQLKELIDAKENN